MVLPRCSTGIRAWWPCGAMSSNDAGCATQARPRARCMRARPRPRSARRTRGHAHPPDVDVLHRRRAVRRGHVHPLRHEPEPRVPGARLASLEGAEDAVVVASGNAACALSLLSCAAAGGHIVAQRDLYGGTLRILNRELPRLGIETTYVADGAWADAAAAEHGSAAAGGAVQSDAARDGHRRGSCVAAGAAASRSLWMPRSRRR
jgi:hypothetical protein